MPLNTFAMRAAWKRNKWNGQMKMMIFSLVHEKAKKKLATSQFNYSQYLPRGYFLRSGIPDS